MRVRVAALGAMLLFVGAASVASAKEDSHKLVGEIVSVDATARTLSVSAHPKAAQTETMTFAVADDAKVMAGARAGDLGQLAVGDPVTVSYTTSGTTPTATRIERAASAAAKPVKTSRY